MTTAAGMNGPHHLFNPNAPNVVEPPLTNAMIAAAHANALIRLSELYFKGFIPA